MNKSKLSKILVPVLALALLIGAMVGVTASANENTTPEIASMNVAYSSQLYLYYAVPVIDDNADGINDNVVLNVYADAECAKLLYSANGKVETIAALGGGQYYVYITSGVAAKELNTPEYVQAVNTETGAKSAVVEYSVEKYLYTKLYNEGYALMTEEDGEEFIRRTLYYDLLKYGSTAQQLFTPNAADKIADGNYIGTKDGIVESGFYNAGAKVSLKSTNVDIIGWNYAQFTAAGELIESAYAANGSVVTLSGQISAIPVYNPVAGAKPSYIDFTAANYSDYFYPVLYDGTVGEVQDGKVVLQNTSSQTPVAVFKPTVKNADANIVIFEADITITGTTTANNNIYIYTGPSGGYANNQYHMWILDGTKGGKFGFMSEYYYNGAASAYGSSKRETVTVNTDSSSTVGEKMTLRIEFFEGAAGQALTRVLVDGVLIHETNVLYGNLYNYDKTAVADASNFNEFRINYNKASVGTMTIENVSFMQVVGEARPEFELIGVDPYTLTFDEMPSTKHFLPGTNTDPAEGIVGEKNSSEIISDATGNSMLHIKKTCSGRDENGTVKSYNYGMAMTQGIMLKEENANVMIFEADIKAENIIYNDVIQIHINGTSSGTGNSPILGVFKFTGKADGSAIQNQSDGVVATNSSATVGEWFHLRIEYRVTGADTIECKYIINDDEAVVSTHVYKKLVAIDDITTVVFAFNNGNQGDYYVDNTSLRLVYEAPAAE